MFKCVLCGKEFVSNSHLELDIEEHLREFHFMTYQEYYEMIKTSYSETLCWKCGISRQQLCPYINSYYLPCRSCISDKKSDIQEATNTIVEYIKDYQKEIMKNKYYQYLLADNNILKAMLPKSFLDISNLLEKLRTRDKLKIGKDSSFSVTRILGSPIELSERNLRNLNISVSDNISVIKNKIGYEITLGDCSFDVLLQEICEYDVRHHSRHSILNLNSKRNTKKLKMESGDCIKFWNTKFQNTKSILQIRNKSGDIIDPDSLSDDYFFLLKISILRSKPIMKRVFEVYNEICKYIETLRDSVFIKNTIFLGVNKNNSLSLTWKPELSNEPGQINISIL